MLNEEQKRRLQLLQQQNNPTGITPVQRMFQKTPTAQEVGKQVFTTAIPNVRTPQTPLVNKVAEAIVPNLVRLGKGYGEVLGQITGVTEKARQAQFQSLNVGNQAISGLSKQLQQPGLNDLQRQNIRSAITNISKLNDQTTADIQKTAQQQIERTDIPKAIGALGMTGLDILTAGVGSKLAPAIKTFQRVAEPTAKVAPTVAQRVGQTATGAGIGAAYTGLNTVQEQGAQATPQGVATSALTGGVIGGIIPNIPTLLSRIFRRQAPTPPVSPAIKPAAEIPTTKVPEVAPTISKAAPEAPQLKVTPTETPKTFGQFTQEAVQAAEQSASKYAKPTVQRKLLELWDPRQAAVKLDKAAADYYKKAGQQYTAADSLDLALSQSSQSTTTAQNYLKESPIQSIIAKYGANTLEGQKFNNYRILKRDIELTQNGRPAINRTLTLDQKIALAKQYEQENPQALNDLRTLVSEVNKVQDLTVTGPNAFIAKSELQAARTKKDGTQYEFYTPLNRALPENVERAVMSGQNLAGLGRQKVLQEMTGSDIPTEISFDAITNYIETVFRQLGNAKVQRILEKRVKEGLIPGARFVQTAEQTAGLTAKKIELKQIRKEAKQIQSKLKVSKRQAAAIKKEMNAIKKEGLKEVTRKIKGGIKGKLVPEGGPKLENIAGLIEQLFTSDMATLNRLNKKFMNREPKLAAKIQEIIKAKTKLEQTQLAKQAVKQEIIDILPDPTTGLQTIIGRNVDGQVYRIELPPEYANLLMGFDKQQLPKILKATRAAQEPFRQAWVGLAAPQFQLSTAIWNAVMAPIISKQGYKLYSPTAAKAAIKALFNQGEVLDLVRKNGGVSFGGNLEKLTSDKTAEALAVSNKFTEKAKWFTELSGVKGFRRGYKKLNEYGGRIDQATRAAAATTAYNKARNSGLTTEQAIAEALKEWNNVLPDYANVSTMVKSIDAVIPFTAASVAGTRTLLRAIKERPVQTIAKLGVAGTVIGGVTFYNLSQESGRKFYQDMKDSNKNYLLDNNLIIVLPGAKKDEKTGEWSGIVKIPIAPELRSINTAVRETLYETSNNKGVPVGTLALSGFDFLTGKLRDQSSPLYQTSVAIATGIDPRSGRQVYDETMNTQEKSAAILNYIRRNLGTPGQMAGGKNAWNEFIGGFVDRVYGAKGSTEKSINYQSIEKAIKEVGLNKNELNRFYGDIMPSSNDLLGNDIKNKTYNDSIRKAIAFLDETKPGGLSKIWRTMVLANNYNKERGLTGNPLYELPDNQARVVLTIKALANNDAAAKVLTNANPWIKDFYKKQSDYYDKVMSKLTDKQRIDAGIDSMGVQIPIATSETQKKLDELSKITDPLQKSQFYSENPEITDYFARQEEYQRFKDSTQGIPLLDPYPTPTPEVKALMDIYNSIPKNNGPLKRDGTASSPDRSAWIKANPQKFAILSNQWNKQTLYQLAKEGALVQYEGVDFSKKTLDKIGMGAGTTSQTFYNMPTTERQYLTDFLKNIKAPEVSQIQNIKAKEVKKYKIKLPSTTRRTKRIRLE